MTKRIETVAILVDGAYFLKQYHKLVEDSHSHSPEQVANNIYDFAKKHAGNNHLHRILYYDCLPFGKKATNPVTKMMIDFKLTRGYQFRKALFEELKKKRKVALRLGVLKDSKTWSLKPAITKNLIEGQINISDLRDSDVQYDLRQKGIDMKIGVDISALALKKIVSRIVLISGDADFVPASKLARREGIDFILDPMWNRIDDSLFEHIDGLNSTCPKPKHFSKSSLTSPSPAPPISADPSPASHRH